MAEISPFHDALYAFLRKYVDHRIGEVPVSFSKDPSVGFEEMVRDVHKALDGNDPGLEWRWISSLSEKEFQFLGLGAKYPRIYRGLPRLYHRDDPSRSIIKENFRNLSALKRESVDRAVASLYEGAKLKGKFRIAVLAWVIADGLGDWTAAVETAEILRAQIPEAEVQIVAISERPLPSAGSISADVSRDRLSEGQLKRLREADLALQIPTYFPDTPKMLHDLHGIFSSRPMPAVEHIGEYGYLESSWFHPKTLNRSMGLHALEKGIFIKKIEPCGFEDVENGDLLELLFGTMVPTQLEIEGYRSQTRFHLAYLSSPKGGAIYLHALLKKWEGESLDIDLLSPDIGWFIQWIQERGGSGVLFAPVGVKEIEVIFRGQRHQLKIQAKGKRVRILCPEKVSAHDMRRFFYLSEDWVAVRGNQSFSEAISAQKPFFYDGRPHALHFVKDLVAMASNRLAGHRFALQIFQAMREAFLWNLPEEKTQWVDETHFQMEEKRGVEPLAWEIGTALQHPSTAPGFKKLCRILAEEHSFASFLVPFVRRQLFHRIHPQLAKEAGEALQLYGKGEISFTALVKNLRRHVLEG